MPWKCPECEEVVEELYYNVNTTGNESGTAYLNTEPNLTELANRRRAEIIDDYDYGDSENNNWDDEPSLECPHCNDQVTTENLIWCEDEEEPEEVKTKPQEDPDETKFKIIGPKIQITDTNRFSDSLRDTIICKKCGHPFVTNPDRRDSSTEEFLCCPKCNTPNTTTEFRQLLADGFFNKLTTKKHDRAKKT